MIRSLTFGALASCLTVGVLAAVLGAAPQQSAQTSTPSQPTFRGTTDIVRVFVTVTDRDGRLVTTLAKDNFEVRDEGKPQAITTFDNTPQPIRLIVMLDVSGSMEGNLRLLNASAEQLFERLRPDDAARVGTFGHDVTISSTFTRNPGELRAALPQSIAPDAPTPLWRGIDDALNGFKGTSDARDEDRRTRFYNRAGDRGGNSSGSNGSSAGSGSSESSSSARGESAKADGDGRADSNGAPAGGAELRPVILVLSDGKDSGPTDFRQRYVSQVDVIERARRDGVMIYAIGMRSRSRQHQMPGIGPGALQQAMQQDLPDPGLARVANETGGGYTEVRMGEDLGAAFARVADELHSQYLIGYAPPKKDGKKHEIDVKVNQRGLEPRARKSYIAEKS